MVVVGGCGPASNSARAEHVGEIAYLSWDGEAHAIHVVRTDGTTEVLATATDGGLDWSPDGTRLAFVRCDPETEVRLDDCKIIVLEDDVERDLGPIDHGNPAWSPDGTEIAFVLCDDTAEEAECAIFAVPADGGTPRRVTRDGVFGQPVWSPDGTRIAFDTSGENGMHVVDASTGDVLWSTDAFDHDPNWSADGRQIAFVRTERLRGREVRHDVYAISADGTGARRITDGLTSAESPAWSPDGTELAFTQWTETPDCPSSALFVANRDGSDARRLTPYRQLHATPAWSPDGRQIAFARIDECWSEKEADLWLISREGGETRPISPDARPEAGTDFAWRPAP